MLRFFLESQGNILGVELSKTITKTDYRELLQPAFDRVIAEHGKVRLLIEFADDFAGFEFRIIGDARYLHKHFKQFEKLALINCPKLMRPLLKIYQLLTQKHCGIFTKSERAQAWHFIESPD